MTAAVGSAQAPPLPSVQTPATVDAPAPDAPAAAASQPPGPSLANGAIVAGETLGALVAEQATRPLDLRGQDLRTTGLAGLDLRGADLTGANLAGMDLTGLDFSGANLTGANLAGALLVDANLSGVTAKGADLSDATLVRTNLDGGDFAAARFDGAYLGSVDRGETAGTKAGDIFKTSQVNLDGASFKGARFQALWFLKTSADGADFSGAVADRLTFHESQVRGASFDAVSGSSLVFIYSHLSDTAITNATVEQKRFSASTLENVRFAGTSFNRTGFSYTNLSVADLTGVVREGRFAGFNNTNLDGLDLRGFDFFGSSWNGDPRTAGPSPVDYSPDGSGASYDGLLLDGSNFEYASMNRVDFKGAAWDGASFSNTMVEGMYQSVFAGKPGVREGSGDASLLGVRRMLLSLETGVEIAPSFSQLQAEADAGLDGAQGPAAVTEAWGKRAGSKAEAPEPQAPSSPTDAPPAAAASRKLNASTAALETLRAVREQIRTAYGEDESFSARPPSPAESERDTAPPRRLRTDFIA